MVKYLTVCVAASLLLAASAFVPQTPTLASLRRQTACAVSMSTGDNSVSRRAALFSIPAVFVAASKVMFIILITSSSCLDSYFTEVYCLISFSPQSAGAYDFSKLRESGRFADEAPAGSAPVPPPAPQPAPVKVRSHVSYFLDV
jgi:hypothetical protein